MGLNETFEGSRVVSDGESPLDSGSIFSIRERLLDGVVGGNDNALRSDKELTAF